MLQQNPASHQRAEVALGEHFRLCRGGCIEINRLKQNIWTELGQQVVRDR